MSQRKTKIIKDILGRSFQSGEEELFHCPKCKHHKQKLSVNFLKGFFKCWICDWNGRKLSQIVFSFGNARQKQEWKSLANVVDFSEVDKVKEKQIVKLPDEFVTLTGKQSNPLSAIPRNYLKKRAITRNDIVWWKIGYCPDGQYGGRIIIPSFDLDGELNYFIARSYGDKWPRYYNPPSEKDFIFNELFLDWNKDITIVEGVFDAIVAGNAIPLLGSTLRENSYIFQKIIENCERIYIALDDDAKLKEEKISKLFMSYGIEVLRVNIEGYSDVGEMPKPTFQERKKTAEFVSMDNYLMERLLYQ